MNDIKNHIKILSALSVAASDTRRDTFISVVIRTLNEITSCERKELTEYINEQFGFKPYEPELDEIVNFLLKERKIDEKHNLLSLSAEEKKKPLMFKILKQEIKKKVDIRISRILLKKT